LLASKVFDYIDLDPFGSPAPSLDAACKRLANKGVIAATATDTAALSGSSVAACVRKYWSRPLKNEFMHEIGMRILIHKIQLIASQYEKVLVPLYGHSTAHYIRVYLQAQRGKTKEVFRHSGYIHYCFRCLNRFTERHNNPKKCCKAPMSVAGPLWLGELWDSKLASKMKGSPLTDLIAQESKVPTVGFYSTHMFAKKHKLGIPKHAILFEKLKKAGYWASLTHFSPESIRTDAPFKEFKKIFIRSV